LAGKTVKCPSCQQPLKIAPAGSGNNKPAAPKPAAAGAKGAPAKAAAPKPAAPAAPRVDDLFDEIGLAPPVEGTRPCPGCSEPMPIEAVLCIKCGYNTRIGRRMHTEVGAGSAEEGGHGAVAQDLLDKAAGEIEGDAAEEKKKTGEGLPWWVYLIVLIILVAIAGAMIMRGGNEEPSEDKKGFFAPSAPALV
jgi:hypothetical protein